MTFDELESYLGSVLAEKVRKVMTLELFKEMEVEELAPYLTLNAARAHSIYVTRKSGTLPAASPASSHDSLCRILERRWHEAESLAEQVALADRTQKRAKSLLMA
ncbi:MAG: hypothetical protein FWF24_03195 [Alphaproteobacteria bacterium]|nr:hypothetical protein [Alphaproteobacteria bacterium]